MDNMFKKCPFCGKELPVDEFFCPYCVHRLDEEAAVKEDVPHKKHRRFIAIIAGVIVIASVLLISITGIIIKSHKKSDNTFTQSDVYNDYSYGMMYGNISQIENTNRYTDSQKNIIEYYDNNYMNLFSYEFLIRYPDIFENMQVKFEAVVEKVVKTDKDSFILLVSWNQTYNRLQEDKWDSCIMLEGKIDDISVAGSSSNGTRVVEGDRIYVYAEFLILENYTIDQNIYNIPKCLANRARKYADGATHGAPSKIAPATIAMNGSLAPQGINVVVIIVILRSLSFSIVREAMIPGTPQPEPISIGMNDLPERPNLRKILSIMNAIRAI